MDKIIHNIISCDEAGVPQTFPARRLPSLISNIAGKSSGVYTKPGLTFGINFGGFLLHQANLPNEQAQSAYSLFKMFYLYNFLPAGK